MNTMTKTKWIAVRAGIDEHFLEHHEPPNTRGPLNLSGINLETLHEDTKVPRVIIMVGTEDKTQTIQRLLKGEVMNAGASRSQEKRNDVHLFVDLTTAISDSPIIFADCELHATSRFKKASIPKPCNHEEECSLIF